MSLAISLVAYLGAVVCIVIGIRNYAKIARQARIANTGMEAEGRIYAYAFKEMRGSRETKLMVFGFATGMLLPCVRIALERFLSV